MDKEYIGLSEKKLCLAQDVFVVRWPLNVPELEKIDQPGTVIEVKEYVQFVNLQTPDKAIKADIGGLVRTCKGGIIPINYLERKPNYELLSDVEKRMAEKWEYKDWRLGTGR